MIDHWIEARSDLGVDVVGPLTIKITEALSVHADVLVRNFGGPKGTIGVEDSTPLRPFIDEIWEAGYGVSEFGPPNEKLPYDRAATVSCLQDWGWSGPPDLKPKWLDCIRIFIAHIDGRFCAEIFRDQKHLGRVCETQDSADYSVEIEPDANDEQLAASIEDAKHLLRQYGDD